MKTISWGRIVNEFFDGASNITLDLAKQRLREANLSFAELPISQDSTILIVELGGRILGPFSGINKRSVLWMPSWWNTSESWKEAIIRKEWNIGGERLWVAPEIQYCITDRFNPTLSYKLPAEMDPGEYHITRPRASLINLEAKMKLKALHYSPPDQQISVGRKVEPAKNPLRNLYQRDLLMKGIQYSGYKHSIQLRIESPDPCLSEAWSIMQVRQGGISILPTFGKPQIGWYYHPEPTSLIEFEKSPMLVHHCEQKLFKIGIHSTSLTGRAGYLHNADGTNPPYLIIRNYRVSPSSEYCEEPFTSPGENGYACHLYNSGNPKERFGEIECHGNAMGGSSEEDTSSLTLETWFFEGNYMQLEMIAHQLLSYQPSTKTIK
ncbi:hypothetical protein [Pleomorphochaeta sp. DL1XJH-081]|uniref:hypothetical protein n=1 Tax=Pleomorphochaeta sp. DL1XJH-081 TaxID=3409690 RepID=UPI003BB51537